MTTTVSQPTGPVPDVTRHLFTLMTGHIISGALQVVARLEIARRLAEGPQTTVSLARDCDVNEGALYRVLRTLASVGVFEEVSPRTFGLTPAGEALGSPAMRGMALWITSPVNMRVHAELMHSVETGSPAVEKVFGVGAFEYFEQNPDVSAIFNDAMTGVSATVVPAVLEAYDFTGIHVLVDVAGGHGGILTAVLEANPSMRGVLFDLEHVIAGAHERIASLGLSDRCATVAGDFFKAVPQGGDAYILKNIIHDWDDDRAAQILRNIGAVLPAGGRVLLVESVIYPGNEPSLGKIMDLEMLAMAGGRERTEEEFRALFDRAGFRLTRIVPTKSPLSVIEARPKATPTA
jgi:hypothetical protein